MSDLFLLRGKKEEEKTRLPPGQHWVDHILGWGTEHRAIVTEIPDIDTGDWVLQVEGSVDQPMEYSWEMFMDLPQVVSVSDFHCVETWSVKDQKWMGVRFTTLMDDVTPTRKAKYCFFEAYDGYTTSLPVSELAGDDVLLAHRLNDKDLPRSLGGPVRLVVPHKYAYKSIMWLNRIQFSERDKLGYWERNGYHNNADPWRRQRYK
ncbi:molybdopterin-dependent oxidoreductase [Candidatus Bathyarchaeota archaeon]|nr:molybdopterin-dependent oxidoreductase [Candidatus Bathyarchaeota archaeon]